MRRQLTLLILAGLSLIASSCGRDSQANTADIPKVHAHTKTIQLAKVSDTFQAPGTIRAKTSTALSSKIVGQVLSLGVREGDRVRQGQMLIEIDDRDASAQLRRVQATADEARRALEEAERSIKAADAAMRAAEANRDLALSTKRRYDVLRERHSVSPQEYDEVETRYRAASLEVERNQETLSATKARSDQVLARIEQAEAEIAAVQVVLGYSRITAPIDGIITSRRIEPGMLAAPGPPLLTIEDDRTYQLEVTVEESRATHIGIGKHARVEIEALAATLDGRVAEIVPAADPGTRTYTVKLDLTPVVGEAQARQPAASRTDTRHSLRSGFFGRALFPGADRQALLIPESALVRRGQLDGVYIVQHDVCVLRLVKTGKRYAEGLEILAGLDPGTRIVVAPSVEISDGVKIVEDRTKGTTP